MGGFLNLVTQEEISIDIHNILRNEQFIRQCKETEVSFTRDRILTFSTLVIFIMTLLRRALQRELVDFIDNLQSGEVDFSKVSKAAFCKARKHLKPIAFVKLSERIIDRFYAPKNDSVLLWKDYRLIAHDGSTAEVPNDEKVINEWGVFKTRSDGKKICMARLEQSYDVLNHLCLSASIDSFSVSEAQLLHRNLSEIKPIKEQDVHILDRYYASYPLIFELTQRGDAFCFRMKKDWWKVVEQFYHSDQADQVIALTLPEKYHQWAQEQGLDQLSLEVRLVKVELDSGEIEVLLTSLTNKNEVSLNDLKELYSLRWGVETAFSALKHKAEFENFSGKSIQIIKQDYFAKLFILNYAAILIQPVDQLLAEKPKKKYIHQVNRNEALARLKYGVIDLFFFGNISQALKKLTEAFKAFTEPIRPGRKYPRHKLPKRKYPRAYCHV
ncbi:MAG: IS4 family transposase [Bacteroidota bacterium]